jgi:hypothetical protein
MQDNRDKEAGMDKAQTDHKRIQKKISVWAKFFSPVQNGPAP